MRRVAAERLDEVAPQIERVEQAIGVVLRLVGQDGQREALGQPLEAGDDAGIGPRMIGEPSIVDGAEPRERGVDVLARAAGGEDTRDQQAGPFADHPHDLVVIERRRVERGEQLVGRLGDVTPRIDERAVEIEHQDRQQ